MAMTTIWRPSRRHAGAHVCARWRGRFWPPALWRLAFLLITAVLSFGSLAALYTRDVTVKLLPFDNKSELAVMIDLPEGASVEATDRVAQDVARIVLAMPEVISVQTHAGTPAPFNFNGLVRHYFLRGGTAIGRGVDHAGAKGRPRPQQP